jgi:uncharacterized membrane protein
MANHMKPAQDDKTAQVLYWASFVLAFLGFLDAVYLLIFKLTGNNDMCLGNGGCHNVNFSPYSEIHGIPISAFGIVAFLSIAGILWLEPRVKFAGQTGPLGIFGISLAGVAFSVYLTWLEIYIIHSICPFCIASAITITLIFILAIIRLIKQTAY